MALHCAATLLLVATDDGVGPEEPGLAATYGPWSDDVDVVTELQHLADQHRGERVRVRLDTSALERVLGHVGRAVGKGRHPARVRVDVGDDGWDVVPWE